MFESYEEYENNYLCPHCGSKEVMKYDDLYIDDIDIDECDYCYVCGDCGESF